ncbi:carbonyl reductase [NADPH] 1-like [Tetranychus urticae]|uniref:carbonyl reductase (NADPH) n=1 Tax=Tetranychus urticae TaxID=32264 RepID=T1L244_TETUR|nr:carbonyl reductase [NADPH] 1-like [Tetranychus urticae]
MGRLAVVTGANKGIGFAIVEALCKKFDGTVMLCSRDLERGQKAVDALKQKGLNPVLHQLEISDQNSINKLAETIKNEYQGLDILVNNAAIAYRRDATDPLVKQAEDTINVNFFANLDVCKTLFPLLRPHARVVNVSSAAGMLKQVTSPEIRQKLTNPDLTEDELVSLVNEYLVDVKAGVHLDKGWPARPYAASKVFLSVLTFIHQREFNKDSREDIVINAVHPGAVDTDLTNHKGPMTIERGAQAPVYCALLPPNSLKPKGDMVWDDSKIVDWQSLE